MSNDKTAATWNGRQQRRPLAINDRIWHVTDGSGTVASVFPTHAMIDFDGGHQALIPIGALSTLPPQSVQAPFLYPTNPQRGHSGKAVWGALALAFLIVVLAVVVLGVRAAVGSPAPFYGACPDTTVNCSTMQPATDLFGDK